MNNPICTISLGNSGFFLDVFDYESNNGFIFNFYGQFRKANDTSIYPKLFWQVVKVMNGKDQFGDLCFALDTDRGTEPFVALFNVEREVYHHQVNDVNEREGDGHLYDLLVINAIDYASSSPIDNEILLSAIKKIEHFQTQGSAITAFFTDDETPSSMFLSSCLKSDGFIRLVYDGFVSPNAKMWFRPQTCISTLAQ
jgi:hypothetical protein